MIGMTSVRSAGLVVALLTFSALARAEPAASDVIANTRQLYTELKTYTDTGVIDDEFAAGEAGRYRHTFKTFFRAPRLFYFEFQADARAGAHRIVIWCSGGDFESWNSSTGQHEVFPRGTGTALTAFQQSAYKTRGSDALIPALLFAGSGLIGTLNEFKPDAGAATAADLGGHKTTRFPGVARSVYPKTQRVTNVRRAEVWLDSETHLVRRVFEDTPEGLPKSSVLRVTTTLEPRFNPALDDAVFRFKPPDAGR